MRNDTFRRIPFKEGHLSSWDSSEVGNRESCLDRCHGYGRWLISWERWEHSRPSQPQSHRLITFTVLISVRVDACKRQSLDI